MIQPSCNHLDWAAPSHRLCWTEQGFDLDPQAGLDLQAGQVEDCRYCLLHRPRYGQQLPLRVRVQLTVPGEPASMHSMIGVADRYVSNEMHDASQGLPSYMHPGEYGEQNAG